MRLAALALVAALLLPAPAQADTPGCVTQHEYHRVHRGMTRGHVHQIFDTHGTAMQASDTRQTRTYPGCHHKVRVYVTYRLQDGRWRVRRWSEEASNVIA